jgi:hypothetical protein
MATNQACTIKKNSIAEKWVFTSRMTQRHEKKFGDYFSASISIATLYNEAYVLKNYIIDKKYIRVGDYRIEREITREGTSPRSQKFCKKELILFPYKYKKNNLIRYQKKEFEKLYPEATKYLESFSENLIKRKSDKNVEWFEYGRTQALAHLNQPKLLLSTIITKEVKLYQLSKDCIPIFWYIHSAKSRFAFKFRERIIEE